jgi:hypothetical protein
MVASGLKSFSNLPFRFLFAAVAVAAFFVLILFKWNDHFDRFQFTHQHGSSKPPADKNEDVAICIATKNNPADLPEFFIHHYHHHGIRRFYIMDDGSSPALSTVKDYGIPRSALSFQYFDAKSQVKEMQDHIYSECQRLYGSLHNWIAYIDADEYIETRNGETLHGILADLKEQGAGAVGMNWRLHTSNGLLERPDSVRKAFTSCAQDPQDVGSPLGWKDNRAIKSIVRTDMWQEPPYSPHMFRTVNGTKTLGEHGDVLADNENVRYPITRDRIGLHHYTVRSKSQFEAKLRTWKAKDWTYWDHIESLPQVECLEMTRYDP